MPYIRRFSRGFIDYVPTDCLDKYPAVVSYLERFCALPELEGRYHDGIGATKKSDDMADSASSGQASASQ